MRFSENLANWFGRVELFALGAEDDRQKASQALARGDAMAARAHAMSLLARVPGSKIGLGLWAEAAEAAGLWEEAISALEPLCEAMPFRADPWLRLSKALEKAGRQEAESREALERAAMAPEGEEARRLAWLALCDRDLGSEDPERASRWLFRFPLDDDDPALGLRRAEHALAARKLDEAKAALEKLGPASPSDGRRALLEGRVRAHEGEASAFDRLLRAFVLEARGAARALAAYVGESRDVVVVSRARAVVRAAGKIEEPRWAAAFALAEGRGEDARRALLRAAREGSAEDPATLEAAEALLDFALRERDPRALGEAISALSRTSRRDLSAGVALSEAIQARGRGDHRAALDLLDAIPGGPAVGWRDSLRADLLRSFLPAEGEADWPAVLYELVRAAKIVDDMEALRRIEAIAVERERPLRLAVVGEFNAGKSTFLNALLGGDVAPTGILPTTATLHWVAWAADPFARILVHGAPDRVVAHADLKRTLRELSTAQAKVDRVFIYAPIELLRRVELLDTPGLNAGEASHTDAAQAAFDEAHVAIWLLDSTQPLKESERAMLALVAKKGLPVLVVLNKRDRLPEESLPEALAHVRDGLSQAGLASLEPPLAFSARLALSGRLGDEEALARSGWEQVERLLDGIVERSVLLRERALRRRAAAIAERLMESVAPQAEREAREEAERKALRERLLYAASRLSVSAEEASVAASMRGPLSELAADLRPLAGEEERELSPAAKRYAIDRAVFRLAMPLFDACLAAARIDDLAEGPSAAILSQTRALVAGAMAAMEGRGSVALPDATALARAAMPMVARALRDVAEAPSSPSQASTLAARIDALSSRLSCRSPVDDAA